MLNQAVRQPTQRGRILIVDDEPAVRLTLQAHLARHFEVTAVASLPEAEDALRRRSFHVAVCDYQLGPHSGLKLLRTIGEHHADTVGILLTGHDRDPEVLAAQREWQQFTVVLKPYDPELMVRYVTNGVARARLRASTHRLSGLMRDGGR